MAEFLLETERLVLRDWREEDWPVFFEHTNTPDVMRWLAGVMDADGEAMQRQRIESCAAQHGHCFWAMQRKDDGGPLSGEFLGFCGLKRSDAPKSPVAGMVEIGWRMRQDAWGHGYAKEGAMASLRAGFEQFGAQEIIALTIIENEASWGLMQRLGMRRRTDLDFDELRYTGKFRKAIVHTITRSEWEQTL